MTGTVTKILCRAYVAPGRVMVNAIVSYDAGMRLVEAVEFQRETASTAHFDGVVVDGRPGDGGKIEITKEGFRQQLQALAEHLVPAEQVTLVPLR